MNKFVLMFQEKIVQEVKNVKEDGEGDWPTTEQLQKLGYLERCIKESLRLYPVVPLIARDIKQPVEICKFLKYIPKINS
jgi:cytochrome P450